MFEMILLAFVYIVAGVALVIALVVALSIIMYAGCALAVYAIDWIVDIIDGRF